MAGYDGYNERRKGKGSPKLGKQQKIAAGALFSIAVCAWAGPVGSDAGQAIHAPARGATGAWAGPVDSDAEQAGRVNGERTDVKGEPVCRTQAGAGPEMVLIAPGTFMQGSPKTEAGRSGDESPQHPITIAKPFALSRCEVTVAEFRRFVEASGYRTEAERGKGCYVWNAESKSGQQNAAFFWRNPGFPQTDGDPVVCVGWNDAKAYLDWLNAGLGLAGKPYRLPTESEWEYAARAGTTSPYFWGNAGQCDYANGADAALQGSKQYPSEWSYAACRDGFANTAPVATFKPNAWGLYDMAGNAWEWVEDCRHEDYTGAPVDGSAWLDTDCTYRSIRGGSWNNEPPDLRSAYRFGLGPDVAGSDLGFRLARTL